MRDAKITPSMLKRDVPIFSPEMGIPGFHSLEFTRRVGLKNSVNNNTNVLVPKVGMRWQPLDEQLTIRAALGVKVSVSHRSSNCIRHLLRD